MRAPEVACRRIGAPLVFFDTASIHFEGRAGETAHRGHHPA